VPPKSEWSRTSNSLCVSLDVGSLFGHGLKNEYVPFPKD
jgi:hypothetical protein